jgi:hypothetical protein
LRTSTEPAAKLNRLTAGTGAVAPRYGRRSRGSRTCACRRPACPRGSGANLPRRHRPRPTRRRQDANAEHARAHAEIQKTRGDVEQAHSELG